MQRSFQFIKSISTYVHRNSFVYRMMRFGIPMYGTLWQIGIKTCQRAFPSTLSTLLLLCPPMAFFFGCLLGYFHFKPRLSRITCTFYWYFAQYKSRICVRPKKKNREKNAVKRWFGRNCQKEDLT